jgi:hypothetical protein
MDEDDITSLQDRSRRLTGSWFYESRLRPAAPNLSIVLAASLKLKETF